MRVEVLGGLERRRRWSQDDKARIVEETLTPGAKVTAVARRNGVAASLVFTWRRQARTCEQVVPSFAPVQIAATEAEESPKLLPAGDSRGRSVVAARIGLIEIDLGNRRRIRVDAHVDPEALARVLEVRAQNPRPPRRSLPDNLPIERVVEPAPCVCGKCGSERLHKLGEVVSKTLECEPRRWKIIEHVREKFSCRDCEAITEAPAPSHPIPRGFAGPNLLAMVLVNKFLLHQPLNRQSKTYAREGVEIGVSTLADRIGACAVALDPIIEAIRVHVMSAERIHADDTTVPVLAKLKTVTGRIWTYVRDDRPFGGTDPPAALFYYSRNRAGEHPQSHLAGYVGLMKADAFDGYNQLYKAQRKPAPILEAACWSHGRRKFFDLAKSGEAPIASEAVRRIDLFEIERTINGKTPEQRLAVRRDKSRPIVADLEIWMRQQRTLLSSGNDTAKAINYLLNRWVAFTRFLDDGRICLSNNAAERALRGVAVGRRNWTFAGSDAGGNRAAAVYTLIETCKMNDVDPQAWLADVLARLPDHPANRVADLLPWNWNATRQSKAAAA